MKFSTRILYIFNSISRELILIFLSRIKIYKMTDIFIKKICNHYIISNDKLNIYLYIYIFIYIYIYIDIYLYIYSNNGLFKEYLNWFDNKHFHSPIRYIISSFRYIIKLSFKLYSFCLKKNFIRYKFYILYYKFNSFNLPL